MGPEAPVVGLRPWSESDLPLLQRLLGEPGMTEHIGGPESPEAIEARHGRYLRHGETDSGALFAITVGEECAPVGWVGYWDSEWPGEPVWEAGWSVLPEWQGRGVATRAVALMIAHARESGARGSVHSFPSPHNAPSNAVCRKNGFVFRGEVDFEYPPGTIGRCNHWRLELHPGT